jgi:hypothetical protein
VTSTLSAARTESPSYLSARETFDAMWVRAFDAFYDKKRVREFIARAQPDQFGDAAPPCREAVLGWIGASEYFPMRFALIAETAALNRPHERFGFDRLLLFVCLIPFVLACLEVEGLSWPAWKSNRQDGTATIRKVVERVRQWIPSSEVSITLAAHSGAGSFVLGFIDASERISDDIERIIFLDANYGFSEAKTHGDKLVVWLKKTAPDRLVVISQFSLF